MNPEIRRRANSLFLAALDHAEDQRAGFVRERAGDDAVLRETVLELLEAEKQLSLLLAPLAARAAGGEAESTPKPRRSLGSASEGRYEHLALLGSGGMGEVSLAFDRELGRRVAIKRLVADDDPELRDRFLREARVLAGLDHPGIVPIYERGVDEDGRLYFAMKFDGSRSMAEWLKDPAVRLERKVAALARAAEAIAFAHARGIIHRDFKPGNVLVGDLGEVVVIDWGLAAIASPAVRRGGPHEELTADARHGAERTEHGTVLGSPSYMSPEQARGQVEQQDARTDVYSLGAVLHELLLGAPPRSRDLPLGEAVRRAARGEVEGVDRTIPRRLPADLLAVARKAMSVEPADRYPGARELLDDLRAWLERRPVSVYRYPMSDRVTRWAMRRSRGIAAVAAILAITVAFLLIGNREIARKREDAEAALAWTRLDRIAALVEDGRLGDARAELDDLEASSGSSVIGVVPRDLLRFALQSDGEDAQLITYRGHGAAVTGVAMLPDDRRAVSASLDGTIRVWNVLTGTTEAVWWDDGAQMVALAVDGSGHTAAVGTDRGEVLIWDLTEGLVRHRLGAFSGEIGNTVAVAPDGALVAWKMVDGSWTVAQPDGSDARRLHGAYLTFAPAGDILLASDAGPIERITGGTHLVLDSRLYTAPRFVAVSPGTGDILIGGELKFAAQIDGSTGRLKRRLAGHTSGIKCGVVFPDGGRLATGSFDATLRIWDLATGAMQRVLSGPEKAVISVATSHSGRLVIGASADGTVRVWSAGDVVGTRIAPATYGVVGPSAWSPDGSLVAVAFPRSVGIVDVIGGVPLLELPTGHSEVAAIEWASQDRLGVLQSDDVVSIWDLRARTLEGCLEATDLIPAPASVAPGEFIVTVDGGEAAVTRAGDTLLPMDPFPFPMRRRRTAFAKQVGHAFTADGQSALVRFDGYKEGIAEAWDIVRLRRLWRARKPGDYYALGFTADSGLAILGLRDSGEVRVVDAHTGSEHFTLSGRGWQPAAVASFSDSRHVALASGPELRILDLAARRAAYRLSHTTGDVTQVSVSAGANRLLVEGGGIHDLYDLDRLRAWRELRATLESLPEHSPVADRARLASRYYELRGLWHEAEAFLGPVGGVVPPEQAERVARIRWLAGNAVEALRVLDSAPPAASASGALRVELLRRAVLRGVSGGALDAGAAP